MKVITLLIVTLCCITPVCAQVISVVDQVEYTAQFPGQSDVLLFDIEPDIIKSLVNQKNSRLDISIPFFNREEIELQLQEVKIFAEGFVLIEKNKQGESIVKTPASRHFTGKIKGEELSSVSISLYDDEITGVLRLPYNTYNLGKLRDKNARHILYHAESSTGIQDFECETIGDRKIRDSHHYSQKSANNCSTAVEIYYECDYDMYTTFGSSSAVSGYVTSMFTEISNIYSNENVPMLISQIVVWTGNDPYADNSSGISDFSNELNNTGFAGDLAQLLTNDPGSHGGIAFVDELCGNNPYSYCDIINTTNPYPTYSWDVQVSAHELGHNFGSVHTHDCAWGPNGNEQIDDCGNLPTGGGSCYDPANPIIPSNGGTIMSYCHLNSVGINFSNGFGPEPGDLIRDKISDCKCDNSTCDTAAEILNDGIYTAKPDSGNGASNQNATHADWFFFTPPTDGKIDISSCGAGEDTRVWIHSGDCQNLLFEAISDDDCDMGNGSNYASQILQFDVEKDSIYYFEWDDRWSNAEFDWSFTFDPVSQMPDCDDENISLSGMIMDSSYNAELTIDADGMIMQGYSITFKAGQEIELMPNFEIESGGELEVAIENCQND